MATTQTILAITQIVVGFAVLLVALGRWGGKLEAGRGGLMSTSPSDAHRPNGQPTVGELARRVKEMQEDRRTWVRSSDLNERLRLRDSADRREREEIWGAIKDLRSKSDRAHQRIDDVIGQG